MRPLGAVITDGNHGIAAHHPLCPCVPLLNGRHNVSLRDCIKRERIDVVHKEDRIARNDAWTSERADGVGDQVHGARREAACSRGARNRIGADVEIGIDFGAKAC